MFEKYCFYQSAWCSTLQCLGALVFESRNFWILTCGRLSCWLCERLTRGERVQLLMDLSVRDLRKDALHGLINILKEHSTAVTEHNRGVWNSLPPLLPSHGQMCVREMVLNPAGRLLPVYLHCVVQALNQNTATVLLFFFLIPSALYIIYLRLVGNVYFSTMAD